MYKVSRSLGWCVWFDFIGVIRICTAGWQRRFASNTLGVWWHLWMFLLICWKRNGSKQTSFRIQRKGFFTLLGCFFWSVTVDGWNPKQPPGMYKSLVNHGTNYQPQLVSRISAINRKIVNFRSWVPPINQLHPPQRYAAPGRSSIANSEDGNTAGEAVFFFFGMLAYRVGLFVGRLSLLFFFLIVFCWGKGWGGWGWLGLRVYQFEMSFGTHEFCQRSRVPMGCTTPSTGL